MTTTIGTPPGGALDPATQAWINAVGAANVSSGRQTVYDTLIAGLKTDGIWTKLDRLWIFAAENSASALVDLVGLDTASAVSSPTFTTDRGYAGNGSSSYIDTTYNPTTNGTYYTLNSANFFFYNRTAGTSDGSFGGGIRITTPDTAQLWIERANSGADHFAFVNSAFPNDSNGGSQSNTQGFWSANRSSSSRTDLYKAGSSIGSNSSDTSSVLPSQSWYTAGGYNNDGSFFAVGTEQIAAIGMGGSLNSTEQGNLYSRIQTYMTAVGANV